MPDELDLYTGALRYKDIDFTFAFDKRELRLIPPEDKRRLIEWDWRMRPLSEGAFAPADPTPVGEKFLIGECNETKHKIIFIPEQGSNLYFYNSVVRIVLAAYIICRLDRDKMDRLSISCPEVDYIHPVNQAISLALGPIDDLHKGIFTLSTQGFDNTTTEKQVFSVDDREVNVYFSISRKVSTKIGESPLSLKSALIFEFDPTSDFDFIMRLWWIAREFIRFLCYRNNVFISSIELSAPYEGRKHENFATLFVLDQDGEVESEALQNSRCIKQEYISGHEGEILSDIAADRIYLRHLPDTYQSGRHIDAARFVMITAAFEWEFHRSYPDGVKKDSTTIDAENSVYEEIQRLINNTRGKIRKIYKFLKRLVRSNSLQSEII